MSKILCTLAWYHDEGLTLKPQLVFSVNPMTHLTVKGGDWRSAKIGNTNATLGARNRFEYSFTGGKSVTRASLVMNTSAIIPPCMWLSKHPHGPPTKRGPRAKPGRKETKEANKKVEEKARKKLEAPKEVKAIEYGRRSSRSRSPRSSSSRREEMIEEMSEPEDNHHRDRRRRLADRRYESPSEEMPRSHHPLRRQESFQHVPTRDSRRDNRRKRLESVSSDASSSDSNRFEYRRSRRQPGRRRAEFDPNAFDNAGDFGDAGGGD